MRGASTGVHTNERSFSYALYTSSALLIAMNHLRILGFAGAHPAVFIVDLASPCSFISHGYLYSNDINPALDANGRLKQEITLSVPSLGGFYTSLCFPLSCSHAHDCDVILGQDWLTECRPVVRGNALGLPASANVEALPANHTWTSSGKFLRWHRSIRADTW